VLLLPLVHFCLVERLPLLLLWGLLLELVQTTNFNLPLGPQTCHQYVQI
jgi:hypothetical protein